jgi:cellulase
MLNYALILTTGLVLQAAAHGVVKKVTVTGGQSYDGYVPYGGTDNKVGWITPGDTDWGFVLPTSYNAPDIICHKGGYPATAAVEVAAGGQLEITWDQWPVSHHGPVIDYLAPAGTDDISKIDKGSLQFVKIAEAGQTGGKTTNPPALLFASDDLINAGLTWKVTIPATIKPGYYVLRHEIIALHEGNQLDKAQNYP